MEKARSREKAVTAIGVIVVILVGLFGPFVIVTDDAPVHGPHDWSAL